MIKYYRIKNIFTLSTLKKVVCNNLSEVIIITLAAIIIGAIAAFMEFDSESEVGQIMDRLDKLIDVVKIDWGRHSNY